MASRREYSMMFQLAAELSGDFKGTFSQAQKHLASMQKELQALNKVQADISAYQKQQKALEATQQKAKVLQQQYDNIEREIRETEGYSAQLENALLAKKQQMDKNQESITKQTAKLEQMGNALREAGVDTSQLSSESKRLTSEMDALQKAQEEAAEGTEEFGEAGETAFEAVSGALAAAGIVAGLKEIGQAYLECVTLAGNFEAAMSNVEALSGANAQDMAALTEKAKELGATTVFTAQEAADAMGYMAMAGWDAADMVSGMDGVLSLAAASGEDLALVSDIVTDSLSAFGLTAADTAHFSDVLAAAATNSNTSVSIMGETFKQSASIAGALGYSIEDVAIAVGLMANSGVKGSAAGTALKNTFNGLLEGVTLTGTALGEYEYSAIKADGTMKTFGDTIDELRGCFQQMTEAERVSNAMALAGQRGYNGLLAILNATNEDYAKLTSSIYSCAGAAEQMAAVKLDNLNGDLEELKSAWEGLQLTLGEQFTDELRDLLDVGTDMVGLIDRFVKENPALVKGLISFVGTLGTATAAVTAFSAATKVLKLLGVSGTFMGIAAGAAALVGVIVGIKEEVEQAVPPVKELTKAAREMQDVFEASTGAFADTITETEAAANVADTYISKLEAMGDYASLGAEEQQSYHNTLAMLCETIPELSNLIDLENNAIHGGTDALRANTAAWAENARAQAYKEELAALQAAYGDVILEAEKNKLGLAKATEKTAAAEKKLADAQARMNVLMEEANAEAKRQYEEYGLIVDSASLLSEEYYALENSLDGLHEEVRMAKLAEDNYREAIEAGAEATAAAEQEIALATEAYENLVGATESAGFATAYTAEQSENLAIAVQDVADRAALLSEAYDTAYTAACDSISGQYALWDEAADKVTVKTSEITAAMADQASYWETYNANLQVLSDRADDIEGLRDVIASFADGSEDSVNAIAGMAKASDDDLKKMVETWTALQKEQDKTAESLAELQTDFTNQMDILQQELEADIEAMDMSNEAMESGKSTILAYIAAAEDMLPQVQLAYGALAQAAVTALANGQIPYTPSSGDIISRGYASGTKSAARGWAWVGERGPELMYMGGGEVVLPADVSAAVTGATPASSDISTGSVQVTFEINGDVTTESVDRLEAYGDDFASRVRQVIEDVTSDMARRLYR